MSAKVFTATINGVPLTEEQLQNGLKQIAVAKEAAKVQPGVFHVGDIVFYLEGATIGVPEPRLFRLVTQREGDRVTVVDTSGMVHQNAPASWYAKAPSGAMFALQRVAR